MMFTKDDTFADKGVKEVLAPVLAVLSSLGGKFVFEDENGTEFVLMKASDVVVGEDKQEQMQLAFPKAPVAPLPPDIPFVEDIDVDAINRDIAVTSIEDSLPMMEPDVVEDDLGLEQEMEPSRPPVRVRFEPIDGDLPFDFRV